MKSLGLATFVTAGLLLVAGCSSNTYADVARFHSNQPINRGTIYVAAADPTQTQSLEFRTHRETVSVELRRQGFQTVPDATQAQYLGTLGITQADNRTEMTLQIKRATDQSAVWEGRSSVAGSPGTQQGTLTWAVPRLAEAMFTDFPGTPGVTQQVRI